MISLHSSIEYGQKHPRLERHGMNKDMLRTILVILETSSLQKGNFKNHRGSAMEFVIQQGQR